MAGFNDTLFLTALWITTAYLEGTLYFTRTILTFFSVNLCFKSLPFASVSSNSLVTFLARHLLFTSNRRALTTLLKQLSFGTSVIFLYNYGRLHLAMASFNKPLSKLPTIVFQM